MLAAERRYDGIVIETTGLANPAPVIQAFSADRVLAAQCRLDGVVTVADALNSPRQLAEHRDAVDQMALASVIILNKGPESASPDAVEARLRAVNPAAPIVRTERGRVEPADILDTHGLELGRVADSLAEPPPEHDHTNADGIGSVTLTSMQPFDAEAVESWLTDLLAVRGENILRTTELIWVSGEPRKLALQSVHILLEGDFAAPWGGPEPHQSRLVFIGRQLDEDRLRSGFLACTSPTAS